MKVIFKCYIFLQINVGSGPKFTEGLKHVYMGYSFKL